MKIEINLKKRHLFLIMLFGIIVAYVYAQTAPNPGHTASQVNIGGSVSNNLENWANSAYSQIANHESRVVSIESSYCRSDGTNCPSVASSIYSIANNQPCPSGTNALICIISPGGITGFNQINSYQPYWSGSVWRASTSGSSTCSRVICG